MELSDLEVFSNCIYHNGIVNYPQGSGNSV